MREYTSTRAKSKTQETIVKTQLNMKRQANSGATRFQKGDVIGDNILLECKTCMKEKSQFVIKKAWLTKNKDEAYQMKKCYSALVFNFGDDHENYYVIDEKLFKNLLSYIHECNK